jgi:hypothetical protein
MGAGQARKPMVGVGREGTADPSTDSTNVESEEWMDAFEAQGTNEMLKRCLVFAAQTVGGGANSDDLIIRELVHDARVDTLHGRLRWDPNDKTLELHLRDSIRWRARDDRKRATQHFSLTRSDEDYSSIADQVEAMMTTDPREESAEARASDLLRELREWMKGDSEVLALLDAYDRGASQKQDLMTLAGLSPVAYHNARERLSWQAKRIKIQPSEGARLRRRRPRHGS